MENEATRQEKVQQKQELRVCTSIGWKMIQEYWFFYAILWQYMVSILANLQLASHSWKEGLCYQTTAPIWFQVVLQDSIGQGHGDWANFSRYCVFSASHPHNYSDISSEKFSIHVVFITSVHLLHLWGTNKNHENWFCWCKMTPFKEPCLDVNMTHYRCSKTKTIWQT